MERTFIQFAIRNWQAELAQCRAQLLSRVALFHGIASFVELLT
jgi:hypothetical protein